MKIFFDSSAFAKRYVEEPESGRVEALCAQASELCVSVICVPEIISGLNRRRREKRITRKDYVLAKQRLIQDVSNLINLGLTPDIIQLAGDILEKNVLRAMDALHVASAVAWNADLFVSYDRRQIAAAKKSRLKTLII